MLVKLLKLNFMALTLGKQLAMQGGRVPVRGLSGLEPAMSYSCMRRALASACRAVGSMQGKASAAAW